MKTKLLLVLILSVAALLVLFSTVGCVASANPTESATPESASPTDESSAPAPTGLLEEVIVTRTPEPTATPGRIEQQVEELAETVGLARTTFLGLSVVHWSNLAI